MNFPADLIIQNDDPLQDGPQSNAKNSMVHSSNRYSTHLSDDGYSTLSESSGGVKRGKKGGKRRINNRDTDGKACCKTQCVLF